MPLQLKSIRARIWVLAVAALLIVSTGSLLSDSGAIFWPPASPPEPDDSIYTSPFTFDAVTDGGTRDADVGPQARIAAGWQLLGGPTALPLVEAMGRVAEAERQANARQLPGGAGDPSTP